MEPPYAIGSVPGLSGHAIAYRWRSLPRVRRHGPVNLKVVPNACCLAWQITMDQLIFAYSLSHTHYWYWYEVGMLKVPAVCHEKFKHTNEVGVCSERAQFLRPKFLGAVLY